MLVVYVARVTSAALSSGTCTWNGIAMTNTGLPQEAGGAPTDLFLVGFYLKIASGATGNIAYTGPAGTYAEMAIVARTFSSLSSGALDNLSGGVGTTSSSPDPGTIATFFNCEGCSGALAQYKVGGPTVGTWTSFTNGQTATANVALSLNEGYKFVDNSGTNVDADQTGTTQSLFAISLNTFN